MEFGTGAVPDIRDDRDYEYDHLALGSASFDWEKGFDIERELGFRLPVKNQNGSSSCVGQAFASYGHVLNAAELLPVYLDKTKDFIDELSAKAVYSQISIGKGKGAYLRDGALNLVKYGANLERDVPSYNDSKPPKEDFMISKSWVTPELYKLARNYQSKEARMIRARNNIDLMAQAIRDGNGLVMGVKGKNNGTWRRAYPVKDANIDWAHAMYAGKARMIAGRKYIGALNSWGGNVGEDGWQWFGEEWFIGNVMFNPWTLIDKRNINFIHFLDRHGKPRRFPAYMMKSIRYMIERRGSRFIK